MDPQPFNANKSAREEGRVTDEGLTAARVTGDTSASGCQGESMMDKVALECGGDISASQEDLLARSSFLGGGAAAAKDDGDEEELFSTPDLTQDPITMCTLPFTQSQSPSPPPPMSPAPRTTPATPPSPDGGDDDDMVSFKQRRKPRVCTRKVRGARIRTPTPSPKQQQLHLDDLDPLYKAVLMIPTTTTSQIPVEDFLVLARQRGFF